MGKISVTFLDGSVKVFEQGIKVCDVAIDLGADVADSALAASIDGKLVDMGTPIEKSCLIRFVTFEDEKGKEVYWHSTSHLMAHAVQELFPNVEFGVGPAIEEGFYYDIDLEKQLTPEDLENIESKMREISQRDEPFVRREIFKDEAIDLFREKGDKYKVEILEEISEGGEIVSLYTEGSFTDLCRGPHVPSVGKLRHFKLLNVSGSYWRGDSRNKQLQRVYGVSYPTSEGLRDYLNRLEEAKRRDHRKIGQDLELFLISPSVGVGLPLWLPRGAVLRETLEQFLRDEQRKRGYLPVVTPHIGNLELYKTSGHYPYYQQSQFAPIQVENELYLLKPMNCPHHFQIYAAKPRSYRDLPLRLAEFGTVYRYEKSGELTGLTRVRCFTVDDAHMFVRQDQLKDELCNVIDLIQTVFRTTGFTDFSTRVSFRDGNVGKYGGEKDLWEQAQRDIQGAAEEMGLDYFVGIGEAAFYGPKIDFIVRDVLGRKWQLGTVQVDYVMPERFGLEYIGNDGKKYRPVVIHRAPFGSLERFIGVLIEQYAGDFPTWLAPVQAVVLPISEKQHSYAENVFNKIRQQGIRVELDTRNEKLSHKIRDWENKKVRYMLVVGEREEANESIAVRKRKEGNKGSIPLVEFIQSVKDEIANKT
jgi:threonyl-tRNA synthetase